MHLTQSLHRNAQQFPQGIATIDDGHSRTWAQLRDDVAQVAGALLASGMQPGDRVAILACNGDVFVDIVYGTVWAGGVINPVNIRWIASEIAYSLENCQTRILLVGPQFEHLVPEIRASAPGLKLVVAIGNTDAHGMMPYADWIARGRRVPDALRRGDDLAAILYTGGTTGFPKGVMLSHRNLCTSVIGSIAGAGATTDGERLLMCAPLFHIAALTTQFIAVTTGLTSVYIPFFDTLAVLRTIERERVTDLFMVPTMLRAMIDHPEFSRFDVSSVIMIRYGASSIDDALLERVIAAFPAASFIQAYGMTELSPVATQLTPADHSPEARAQGRGRTAGRAIPVVEVRIVNARDDEVPRGEVGEIVVRGDNVMLGYWNLPAQTTEALRGGWMHTGDMGRMDDQGYVTIVDRLKDMIITGGENVYSAEVENALCSHPSVRQVAVVALPDEKWGEAVHAVIVLHEGHAGDPEALRAHAAQSIARFKLPRSFAFVDSLPLSAAGKVLKNILRDQQRAEMDHRESA